MITNILVPTDFSTVADNALDYALGLAQKCKAEIHVLHVSALPMTDAYFPANAYTLIMSNMAESAKENFSKMEQKYKGKGVKYFHTTVMGSVNIEIERYSERNQIDLVVMGTTGASGVAGVLFGSNTASVVAQSKVPVLAVPENAKWKDLKHLVYATDYIEPEFPAVSRIIYLAELFEAKVTVLHVRTEYAEYVDKSFSFFEKNRKHISYKRWKSVEIEEDNAMEGINEYLEKEKSDLLVLAKHNRSFFGRIFHRSLSKRMAYNTKIPLLVLNKS